MEEFQDGDALLVVDIQNDFCPGGALGVPGGDATIPILNKWIRKALEARIPIFFSRDWHPANHISFKERGGPWPPHCVQNTEGAAFHRRLLIPETAIVINKAENADQESYSAFGSTQLTAHLRSANVRRLWVGGLALDYCVLQTALDARQLGLDVHVLLDATRAINAKPGDEERALEDMKMAGVSLHPGN